MISSLPLWAEESRDTINVRMRELEEVSVTGHLEELQQAGYRLVSTMSKEEISLLPVATVADLLQHIPGVDIRKRGASGVQADLSMHGGTGKQVKVFLNGIDITDPQTEHYTMDLPIDALIIERIEVLQGTNYAIDAFAGAVNIVTKDLEFKGLEFTGQLTAGEYGLVNPTLATRVCRVMSGCNAWK